jgi:hypothetical protein
VNSRHPVRARSGVTLHVVPGTGEEGDAADGAPKSRSFRRYPLWRVLLTNGLTFVHYIAGASAIVVAYPNHPILGWPIGLAYFVYAVVQLYVLMPLVVCPGCVYASIPGGRCSSGLSLIAARLRPAPAQSAGFENRAQGALCQSSLCLWSLAAPLPIALPGLVVSFSWIGFAFNLAVAALTAVRLTGVFRLVVCSHCLARRWCPVARTRWSV